MEVEDDLARRPGKGIEEQVNEQALDGTRVDGDFAVAVGTVARRVFQPAKRALAAQRRTVGTACLQPIREQRQDGIETQVIVVGDVLIVQREADDPLADEGAQHMHHPARIAPVPKARRDRSISPIARSASRSSNAPASDVTAPPSHAASIRRPSNPSNRNCSETHCVGIGPCIRI